MVGNCSERGGDGMAAYCQQLVVLWESEENLDSSRHTLGWSQPIRVEVHRENDRTGDPICFGLLAEDCEG
jgi:hypothetical protein